jgi:hypothetical protein
MLLVRVLVPTATSVAVVLLLTGHHVVLIVATAAAAYLVTIMAIGPVDWSTVASMRRMQVME